MEDLQGKDMGGLKLNIGKATSKLKSARMEQEVRSI